MKIPPLPRRRFLGLAAITAATRLGAGAPWVHPRKVLLWECTRKEFREALEEGRLKVVILPTGSTEQHNEHLAMIQDTGSATLVAQQAALRLYPHVLVATPVAVGISPHWMDRKGTLTLRRETFLAVVYEICESLATHGVRSILILNGHGGNEAPLKESVDGFRRKLGIRLEVHSYWEAYTPEMAKRLLTTGRIPGHAAEFETSLALAAFPERVRWEGVDYDKVKGKLGIKDPKSAEEDELFAREARLATAAKGEALIAIAVEWLVDRLRAMMQA
ncbi:MAG: creatininase family protein [Bryobacteraceae bacterium]